MQISRYFSEYANNSEIFIENNFIMAYKKEISLRIRQIIHELTGGNKTEFGRMVGENEAKIRSYTNESGNISMPSAEFISKIIEKTNYSANWILLGLGEKYVENTQKIEVTGNNSYLVDKLIETTRELKDKDVIIKELKNKINKLEREKKELIGYVVAAEPSPELR